MITVRAARLLDVHLVMLQLAPAKRFQPVFKPTIIATRVTLPKVKSAHHAALVMNWLPTAELHLQGLLFEVPSAITIIRALGARIAIPFDPALRRAANSQVFRFRNIAAVATTAPPVTTDPEPSVTVILLT